ncbi:hybrid non-ribosomal peptide synthetase/type I polyketide synthase [Streptomyces hirsutus]
MPPLRLAARLHARGVRPGDLVGLLTEPGADTVVGVVGILRAGAGWVPLDAGAPHRPGRPTGPHRRATVVCHAATRRTPRRCTPVRASPTAQRALLRRELTEAA